MVHTLFEALVLVVLVVILFLQTWRASIIPLMAVPVSLIGTFAVMHMIGFSLNALSLFGLVLAIGIVVDDAIVVVENVERNIEPRPQAGGRHQACHARGDRADHRHALVLCGGVHPDRLHLAACTGQFYRQFALTIAISTVISAFNSLTLSPALAAVLLKGHPRAEGPLRGGPRRAPRQLAVPGPFDRPLRNAPAMATATRCAGWCGQRPGPGGVWRACLA